jgi:hypothetical protein
MRAVTRSLSAGLLAVVMLAVASAPARSDDPVSSAVRFNREIIRIFDRKCLSCHAPGGIAMSLATYRDVRPWARAIREEIVEQRMPPWSAARGYGRFQDDIGLTPRELSTILTWVDGGVPRGDESDLPAPHGSAPAAAATPDLTVAIPPQQVPGDGEDTIRRVTVDTGLTRDRWIRQIQVRPGDRRLLRAAFVSIVSEGRPPVWAAAWIPWQPVVTPAPPGAFLVRAGSRLEIELHYRGQDAPASDSSAVGLVFAPEGDWRELTSISIATGEALNTGAAGVRRKGQAALTRDALIWGLRPELPVDGQSLEVTARKPDGSLQVLLWIPSARAAWPAPFIFKEPVHLPAGSVVTVTTAGTQAPPGVRTTLTLQHGS